MSSVITQEQLKALLWYHPETGVFRWRCGRSNLKRQPWSEAGHLHKNGYVNIFIGEQFYKAHRLAWLYMTGSFPELSIDHINRVRSDNRWSNLREAEIKQNQWNAAKRSDNTSGIKGVHFNNKDKKWVASCRVGGTRFYLGSFTSIEQAANAVHKFRSENHGEFAHH